jgi:glutamine synthetase
VEKLLFRNLQEYYEKFSLTPNAEEFIIFLQGNQAYMLEEILDYIERLPESSGLDRGFYEQGLLDFVKHAELEKAIKGDSGKLNNAVQVLLKKVVTEHEAIIFNGDGYSDEWHKEAEIRGLPNLKTTPEALPEITSKPVIDLFTAYGVLSEAELHSRQEIYLEQYSKTINTEANLAIRLAKTVIFPAAMRYQGELAATCANLKAIGHDVKMITLEDVTTKLRTLQKAVGELEVKLEKVPHGDTLKEAEYFCETILPAINMVREWADYLETVVADDLWALPSYQEMLFIK